MTTYSVASSSQPLAAGDVAFLLPPNAPTVFRRSPVPMVTKPKALADIFPRDRKCLGIVVENPATSEVVEVVDFGVVPSSVTSLGLGAVAVVRASASLRCERVIDGTLGVDDTILGICNAAGDLTLNQAYALAHGGNQLTITSSTRPIFNVRDYGAKGDSDLAGGGTDDYPAFVAAMNAMGNAANVIGGVLYVPCGAYRLSQPLHITRQMIVEGEPSAFRSPASLLVFDSVVGIKPAGWRPSSSKTIGTLVMPSVFNNFYYRCTKTGTTDITRTQIVAAKSRCYASRWWGRMDLRELTGECVRRCGWRVYFAGFG